MITEKDLRIELIFKKSRTMWLSQDELKELIEVRDSNTALSELAGIVISDQRAKMCGERVWK